MAEYIHFRDGQTRKRKSTCIHRAALERTSHSHMLKTSYWKVSRQTQMALVYGFKWPVYTWHKQFPESTTSETQFAQLSPSRWHSACVQKNRKRSVKWFSLYCRSQTGMQKDLWKWPCNVVYICCRGCIGKGRQRRRKKTFSSLSLFADYCDVYQLLMVNASDTN